MQYKDNTKQANLKFSNIQSRPNRVAKGMTKTLERMRTQGRELISNPKHPNYNKRGNYLEVLHLSVKGTTDTLAGLNTGYKKLVKKEHPTDKGYFKEVYILTEAGKQKLKRLKNENISRR